MSYWYRRLTTYNTSPGCLHPQQSKHSPLYDNPSLTMYPDALLKGGVWGQDYATLVLNFFVYDSLDRIHKIITFFLFSSIAKLVAGSIVTDSLRSITRSFESSPEELQVQIACSPVFTPGLQCAAMLLNVSLRRLVLALKKRNKRKEEEEGGVASDVDSSKSDDGASEEIRELEVCVSLAVKE